MKTRDYFRAAILLGLSFIGQSLQAKEGAKPEIAVQGSLYEALIQQKKNGVQLQTLSTFSREPLIRDLVEREMRTRQEVEEIFGALFEENEIRIFNPEYRRQGFTPNSARPTVFLGSVRTANGSTRTNSLSTSIPVGTTNKVDAKNQFSVTQKR